MVVLSCESLVCLNFFESMFPFKMMNYEGRKRNQIAKISIWSKMLHVRLSVPRSCFVRVVLNYGHSNIYRRDGNFSCLKPGQSLFNQWVFYLTCIKLGRSIRV
jgi:hypothetical protein